jgi:uncharacterized membrane protein YbhN (UPF0104 family)
MAAAPSAARALPGGLRGRPWWPWARRALTALFFGLVAWLLVTHARDVKWNEVLGAVRKLPPQSLLWAALLAAASHGLYSGFDLLGRRATGHGLPTARVMGVTFISYAFNLNLGSLVGGVAFRYRLYARLGLDNGAITRVLGISMFTNWLGYLLLAGVVFLLRPPALPAGWAIGETGLRVLGAVLLTLPMVYVAACALSSRREWTLRGRSFGLPSLRFATLQLLMSCANWLLIAATVFMLLQQRVDFPATLAVLLLAAVAGVIAHVPAGLGVLEAVFVALFAGRLPQGEVLAALLAYRAIYYLAPLALAALLYLVLELRAAKTRA